MISADALPEIDPPAETGLQLLSDRPRKREQTLVLPTGDNVEPRDLILVVAGDAVTSETKRAIELAESRKQAMALLLMSPEFQRR